MKKLNQVLLVLFFISVSVLNFEIIATRISSVIFVNSYAFIILSLAIMGLAAGAIYEYYKYRNKKKSEKSRGNFKLFAPVLYHALSCILFVLVVTQLKIITTPFIFFGFLFLPFFFAGIFYSHVFTIYSAESFKIYAADLTGAAVGSLLPLVILPGIGPVNGILGVSILILTVAGMIVLIWKSKKTAGSIFATGLIAAFAIVLFLPADFFGKIPIGEFEEKDFHHVYNDPGIESKIIDSRWSVFGRSDLVEHSHQDMVKHIFIDGAAGSQMYRFGGNVSQVDPRLSSLLLQYTNAMPFLLLAPEQKNSMLVIGPGGGKEVLTGLISDVASITGVEINSDFVDIVKENSGFNGGIYTDFPNVSIRVSEGRKFVKETERTFDLIVMALPSTQQLQSIDSYALSENYLLTVESIQDYLDILTPEGQLIFTVHNNWEMSKLIMTTVAAFDKLGIDRKTSLNHLLAVETNFSPTLVVRKTAFSHDATTRILQFSASLPPQIPEITYLPYNWGNIPVTLGNKILGQLNNENLEMEDIVEAKEYNISPVYDDNPYFYNLHKGVPESFSTLLKMLIPILLIIIFVPLMKARKKETPKNVRVLVRMIVFFISLGAGFMMMEVSLFQKLILFLGSPTISLSVLLCSILVGMGIGSIVTDQFGIGSGYQRLLYFCVGVVVTGAISMTMYPGILEALLAETRIFRAVVTFLLVLPLGFVLGIPFPTCIRLLEEHNLETYIPWMYGLNGAMSIFGSVMVVIISMIYGFTLAFFIGLGLYLLIILIVIFSRKEVMLNNTESL